MAILDDLKIKSKDEHLKVERVLINELNNITTNEDYGKLLERLFLFYEPLENAVHKIVKKSLIPDIDQRKHVHMINLDFEKLQYKLGYITKNYTPHIRSVSYALGSLYVMEGSTMGGRIIAKMLKKKNEKFSTFYFNSYDTRTEDMWHSFKTTIILIEPDIHYEEMYLGAIETFENLRLWLLSTSSSENISE
ncbi:biliverdin-producing heme oxygenase [Cytophaga sp. FL35]|uniref:biliverdin-producing heme oxygenase n=1 Tax=Cytophaga sp. FL35 TaxID=1904456 RepID=UPI001653D976|nr:biliverdin-producing heme oxygenase [Cytophaga sp. FL35]MBC7000733.1 biliverdin-producing heme oxygenase [Cytophaga sp. FL35]